MRRQIILVAIVLSLAGAVLPSYAQRGKGGSKVGNGPLGVPPQGTDTAGNKLKDYLYGVVKTVDEDQMVLTKTKSGADQTFKFNKKTKFTRDGKDGTFQSLKVGDEVWVESDEDKKTGDLVARKVVTGAFLMPSY